MSTGWKAGDLAAIGDADELVIASRRDDGTLRPGITIWAVRVGSDVFVRSAYGAENGWFKRALASGSGTVDAGGVHADVTFKPVTDHELDGPISDAYRAKYGHYSASTVDPVVSAESERATLRVTPAA